MNKQQTIKVLISKLQPFTPYKLSFFMDKTQCIYALVADGKRVVHAEKGIDKFACGLQGALNWLSNIEAE